MKKHLLVAVAAILAWNASAQDIRMGTEGGYLPWNYVDSSGKLQGYDIDVIKEVENRTDLRVEWEILDFDALIPNLMAGRLNAVMSGMTANDERRQSIDFTTPYAEIPNVFAAKENFGELKDIAALKAALKGKTVGVLASTTHATFVETEFGDGVELRTYRTSSEVYSDLDTGRIDAAFAEETAIQIYLEEHPNAFKIFGPKLTGADNKLFGDGMAIGVRKDNQELTQKFNEALESMRKDGTLSKLAIKHFGFDASK
ncbi:MAG: transporter substrate-binding domain-containing protein [Alphaproteobacteria bacterium]